MRLGGEELLREQRAAAVEVAETEKESQAAMPCHAMARSERASEQERWQRQRRRGEERRGEERRGEAEEEETTPPANLRQPRCGAVLYSSSGVEWSSVSGVAWRGVE